MNDNVDQHNYIRLKNGYDLSYKFLDSEQAHNGLCTSLSSSGIFFTCNQSIDTGKALEIHIPAQSVATPAMTAFIEVVRSTQLDTQLFEIDGTIKSIKAN